MSCPLRFCRLISTPAVMPSPGTSGRLNPNALASGSANSLRLMRAGDRIERVVRRTLVPRLHVEEDRRAVRRARLREKVEPDERHDVPHRRLGADDLFNRCDRRLGALKRRGVGQLHRERHVSLVFRRDESGRNAAPENTSKPDDYEKDGDPNRRTADHRIHRADVPVRGTREQAIEPAEEARRVRRFGFGEQQRAERRRQRQRDDARQHDGDHDRHRELLEQLAGHAADERHRHEHRTEHEHDRDERAPHLANRLVRGEPRLEALARHDAFDVLDDDDGVVHDDADRQHETEQRQHVDRHPEREQIRGTCR